MSRRVLLLLLIVCTAARAQNLTNPAPAIPSPLEPWVGWVLHGHEQERCPLIYGSDRLQCAWPSRLRLDLEDKGGRFTQEWYVDATIWVPLPGDLRTWPQNVRVDENEAVAVEREGQAQVRLDAGRHVVTGSFSWDGLPQTLAVTKDIALLALSVRGETLAFPERDDERVWLQNRSAPREQNRIEISVHRRIVDDVPLQITTRIELQVSGQHREEILGQPLLEGFVAIALQSPLPVRLEADGRLRVQVRPGSWTIDVVARHQGPVQALRFDSPGDPWDTQEIWVFDARNDLRVVTVEGVPAVDPQQTELPEEWRTLPAYALQAGDTMRLVEKQRGNADPAPDRLVVVRTWWLDFDGGGYTTRDNITGTMSRSWRLSVIPPVHLGRVAIDGQDQLITESPAGGAGVEVRAADIKVEAESRVEGSIRTLQAVGWDHDVQQLSGELNLGPGWRLLHATGVDFASPSWVNTWTLFDLFVVLLVALGFSRLLGKPCGALALVTLVLTYIEPEASGVAWVAVLVTEAAVRVLPPGRWTQAAKLARLGALALLLLVTIPFMVQQARQALHPGLGKSSAAAPSEFEAFRARGGAKLAEAPSSLAFDRVARPSPTPSRYEAYTDVAANVQTGPGVPAWQWNSVSLRWSGPVEASQQLHLMLIPPWLNRLLEIARVALLAALILCVARGMRSLSGGSPFAILLPLALLLVAPMARAQAPSADLLEELRQRLLEPPSCKPSCAASADMSLEADAHSLRLRLNIDAAAAIAVPLPGRTNQWVAQTVLVDGKPALALVRDDGLLWLRLDAGRHEVVLQGELPARDEVQIHLPLLPHRVRTTAEGWSVQGVHEDGIADADLVLLRTRNANEAASGILEPNRLAPFVQIERELQLNLTWEVTTTITRLTPVGAAAVLEIPLLPGEAVTTPDVRVVDGKALVTLGANDVTREWRSLLPQAEHLQLKAGDSPSWTEIWRVEASPIWHVEAAGIPPVHASVPTDNRLREWKPWPGETVELAVTRPSALAGRTITIDSSEASIGPALRATDVHLYLSLRSSRAGELALTLPESAQLQEVAIGGSPQPVRQEGRKVTVPLLSGAHQLQLFWRQPEGVRAHFVSPAIDLGAASVNANVLVAMPEDRWTLFTSGPRLGPAVLFWGLLGIFLMASLALGRVRLTPLAWHQWFLLSIGLTQAPIVVALVVVGWLLLLGWRREHGAAQSRREFNALQVLILLATVAAIAGLLYSIQRGLLGLPEMQIAGNDSTAYQLRWFHDIAAPVLPQVTVVSVPLFVYRVMMLLWALWLARALLEWLRWGWESFSTGGLWRPAAQRGESASPTSV